MTRTKPGLNAWLCAVLCAVCILAGTALLAARVSESRFYRQSQLLRVIAAEEQLNLVATLQDGEARGLLFQFITAVTNAYVRFEMIPYNEAQTFVALLGSMPAGLHIEQLTYHRRDLIIQGVAQTPEAYQRFTGALRDTGRFQGVVGHSYLTVEDTVRFEIECLSLSA